MLNTLIIWVAKQLTAYAIGKLAKHLGVDQAADHLEGVLIGHNVPLKRDPNPSPASERLPKQPWLNGSDSISDISG